MKKTIIYLLLTLFAAEITSAQEGGPWWKFGLGGRDKPTLHAPRNANDSRRKHDRQPAGGSHRGRSEATSKMREKMRGHQEAIRQLAQRVRNETDPAKKEQMVSQLREMLTKNAEHMQAEFRKRLEKAEEEVEKMKQRLEEGETQMSARIEEHLQKILAGERPERNKSARGKQPSKRGRKEKPAAE